MDILSGNISSIIFRQVIKDDLGDFSLDSQILRVFLAFDGKKTLDKVAEENKIDMGDMREIIYRLVALELIEAANKEKLTLDKEFYNFLTAQLSRAIGPIAQVLIEEVIGELGYSATHFPSSQAAELVDLLAREIQRDEKRGAFKLNMVNKIKQKGY